MQTHIQYSRAEVTKTYNNWNTLIKYIYLLNQTGTISTLNKWKVTKGQFLKLFH